MITHRVGDEQLQAQAGLAAAEIDFYFSFEREFAPKRPLFS